MPHNRAVLLLDPDFPLCEKATREVTLAVNLHPEVTAMPVFRGCILISSSGQVDIRVTGRWIMDRFPSLPYVIFPAGAPDDVLDTVGMLNDDAKKVASLWRSPTFGIPLVI